MTPRGKRVAVRLFLGVLLAAVLLYGGAHAAIRSPWFRVAVERRLSQAAGMEVRVGRIRTTESLNLRIGDVSALEDRVGMEIRVLRVKWNLWPARGRRHIRRLVAEDAVLTMAPGKEDGHLLPAFVGDRVWTFLGRLTRDLVPLIAPPPEELRTAEPQDSGAPSPARDGIESLPDFRLIRGVVSLRDASGRERASAKDLEVERILQGSGGTASERWTIQADVLTIEGMQQTGVEWSALHDAQGWKVLHFKTREISGWEPADGGDALQDAAETYRELLDSI